jgi:uncharacterized protein DUF4136
MFWRIFITSWLLILPAVAMAESRYDIDRTKNFSKYRTFTLEVSPPVRNGQVDEDNTLSMDRFRQAVSYQLKLRGLTPTDSGADLTVKVKINEYEQTELVGYGPWYGPWGGYGYGYGYGYWGYPYYGGNFYTYTYLEGATTVDVLERATGDLVYRAEVTKTVDHDADDLYRDANKVARKAFKKYPVGGGFEDD